MGLQRCLDHSASRRHKLCRGTITSAAKTRTSLIYMGQFDERMHFTTRIIAIEGYKLNFLFPPHELRSRDTRDDVINPPLCRPLAKVPKPNSMIRLKRQYTMPNHPSLGTS